MSIHGEPMATGSSRQQGLSREVRFQAARCPSVVVCTVRLAYPHRVAHNSMMTVDAPVPQRALLTTLKSLLGSRRRNASSPVAASAARAQQSADRPRDVRVNPHEEQPRETRMSPVTPYVTIRPGSGAWNRNFAI